MDLWTEGLKMELDAGAAIAAGLIGGGVMSVLLYMGIGMMPNQMKMNRAPRST